MIQTIEEAIFYFSDNILYVDMSAILTEIGAALVSSPSREEGSIVGEDLEGNHIQLVEDADQDMENLIIEGFPDTFTEIRESGFAGDHIERDTRVGSVGSSSIFISQKGKDFVGIETSIQIAEKVNEEYTGRIVAGGAERGIAVSDQGTNEGKIDQRSDHPGGATFDGTIREDFNKSLFELVMGEPVDVGKGFWVRKGNFAIDLIKFCANMVNGESFKRGHHNASPGQELALLPNPSLAAEFFSKVFPQRIDVNLLNTSMEEVIMTSFGSTSCFSQTDPVSSPITGSLETILLDEGFQKNNRIVIDGKPIGRDPGGIEG